MERSIIRDGQLDIQETLRRLDIDGFHIADWVNSPNEVDTEPHEAKVRFGHWVED